MAAGVPIKKPVAGISCGLVTGETDDDYIVLTDIQGLEDFFGDMDFKVAGTHDGITAIQMDIKIHGLTVRLLRKRLPEQKKQENISYRSYGKMYCRAENTGERLCAEDRSDHDRSGENR